MIERHPSIEPAHPGEILRDDILNEKQPVTAEMAVRFGKLFGNGGRFWVNLQRSYDLAVAERTVDVSRIPTLEAQAG